MRGERSRALLCIVSVNGRIRTEQCDPKAAPGHWRAVTGEISLFQEGGDAGRRMWGLRKCSKLYLCSTLGSPLEPPQVHWAVARGAEHRQHWQGRRIVKVLPEFSENCENSPRKNAVNACWVWVDQLSAPHCRLRCPFSVASLLLMSLSLGLFSCFLCLCRLSEGNVANTAWCSAGWPVLFL